MMIFHQLVFLSIKTFRVEEENAPVKTLQHMYTAHLHSTKSVPLFTSTLVLCIHLLAFTTVAVLPTNYKDQKGKNKELIRTQFM